MQQGSRFETAEEKLVDVVYYTNPFDPRLFSGLCHLIPSAKDSHRQQRTDVNIFLSYPLASELLEAELTEYRMAVAGLKGFSQAGGASAKSERTDSSAASASARCDVDNQADRRPSPSSPGNFCDESDAALKLGEYVSKDDVQICRRFNGRQFLVDQNESPSTATGKAAHLYSSTDAAETHMDARTLANEIGSTVFAQQHLLAKRCDASSLLSERGYAYDGQAEMVASQFALANSRDYREPTYESGRGKLSTSNRIKSLSDPNLYSAWMQAVANAKDSNARGHIEDESNHTMATAGMQSGAWPRGSRAVDGAIRGQQFLPPARTVPQPIPQSAYTMDSSYRAALSSIAAASTAGSRPAGRAGAPANGNAYQWPNSCWVYDERNRPVFVSGCPASAYAQHSRLQYVPFSLPQIRTGMQSTALAGHAMRQFNLPQQHANIVRYGHLLPRNYTSNSSGLPAAGCGGSFVQFPMTCRPSAVSSQPIKQTAYAQNFAKYHQTSLASSAAQGGQYHMCGGGGPVHAPHPDQFKTERHSVAGLQSVQELANLRASYKQLHQDPCPVSSPAAAAGLATAVAAAAAAADSAAAAASTERALAALNDVLSNKGFDECLSCNNRDGGRDGGGGVASAYAYLHARDAGQYEVAQYGPLKAEHEPATAVGDVVAGVAKETPTALDLLQHEFKLSLASADDAAMSQASLAADVARSCAAARAATRAASDRRHAFRGLPASVDGISMEEASCLVGVPTACGAMGNAGACGGADLSAAASYARALNFQTVRTKKGVVQRLTFGGGYC